LNEKRAAQKGAEEDENEGNDTDSSDSEESVKSFFEK